MSKWENYGKWRYPEIWWEIKSITYFEKYYNQKLILNPILIKIQKDEIEFILVSESDVLIVTKRKIELMG
jgi:hypothetical protein